MGKDNVLYTIPLVSLKEGVHELTYEIKKEFIDENKIDGVLDADLELIVTFTKRENLHELEYVIQGTMLVECDRCLDSFDIDIYTEEKVYIKSTEHGERFEETDDVIIIHPEDIKIDITHSIYESLLLALPIQKIHQDDTCNTNMLQYIQKEEKIEKKTDSRWDSLKDLFDN